jgi:hypothetical protein
MAGDAELCQRLRARAQWVERFSPDLVLPRFAQQLEKLVTDSGHPPEIVGEREPSGV